MDFFQTVRGVRRLATQPQIKIKKSKVITRRKVAKKGVKKQRKSRSNKKSRKSIF